MRYLDLCKSKYNKIVHISKEALKYYLYLYFNERIDPNLKELLNLFIDYDKNKENGKEKNEINSLYEKPFKIKFDTALDFFLKENFGIEDDNSKLEKKLEEIESKKNLFLDKYDDYINDGWRKLLIIYDKFENKEKKII
jgi:hypothetical protein